MEHKKVGLDRQIIIRYISRVTDHTFNSRKNSLLL